MQFEARAATAGPEFLTKEQAAQIVQLHPKTIEREILRGKLSAHKLAGKTRIHRGALEAWITANVVAPSIHSI